MKLFHLIISFIIFYIAVFANVKLAKAATFSVIADGLDNVKGLTFAPDGSLYVTETGRGGNGSCISAPSSQGNLCYGTSGAVTKIKNGTQQRILTGLPSIAPPDGNGTAGGPSDIKFDSNGQPFILMSLAANPALRDNIFGDTTLGKIITPNFNNNTWNTIADISGYELANNPDKADVNSNPLAFLVDASNIITVDAGANSVLSVGTDGSSLNLLSIIPKQTITNPVFPPSQAQSFDSTQVKLPDAADNLLPSQSEIQPVPSAVAKNAKSEYYVSVFTGFPFPESKAKIYQIGTDGKPTVFADGFTQLTDIDFDAQGNLYALQYANESAWKGNLDGSLIKITPDGDRTTLLSGNGLQAPSALAISPDGDIYISNRGGFSGQGQVIKLDINSTKSVPEPTSTLGLIVITAFGAICSKGNREERTGNRENSHNKN